MTGTEDELRQLFKAAGHSRAAVDLTERIMARVAVTPLLRPRPVQPLMSRKAWIGIAGGAAIFLLLTVTMAPSSAAFAGPMDLVRKAVYGTLVQASAWASWLMGISVCMLILTLLDRLLAARGRSV